jgi:exodeoxyribonuclease VII small subunit
VANRKAADDEPAFEESLAELERIVGDLESGEMGLGDALDAYEAGVKHLKNCHMLLERAERRIELLSGVDASGNAIAEPFEEHASEDLSQQASSRTRKRSARGTSRPDDCDPVQPASVDDPPALF